MGLNYNGEAFSESLDCINCKDIFSSFQKNDRYYDDTMSVCLSAVFLSSIDLSINHLSIYTKKKILVDERLCS